MKLTIIGGGSWGVTLANILSCNGHQVLIYERSYEKVEIINNLHVNPHFPNYSIEKSIVGTTELETAMAYSDKIVLAIPSKAFRPVLKQIQEVANEPKLFINVAKGIEPDTLYTISQVVYDELDNNLIKGFVTLSGPSLAKDVMDKKITLVVAASKEIEDANLVQQLFSNQEYFRVYTSTDLLGVEANGSVKNAIALIAGIVEGLDLGENARAALICRGLDELKKVTSTYGGKPESLFGLSGLGDLIVTSISRKSRNFQAGLKISAGLNIEDIERDSKEIVEGPRTIISCHQIALKNQLELPIIDTAYRVLYEDADLRSSILSLMERDLRSE